MYTFKNLSKIPGLMALTLSLTLFSCATSGAYKPALYGNLGAPKDAVPFMPAARTGTLPNGLKYYILENAMPEGRAYLTMAVHAGSLQEEDDQQGLAHFVEHMAFNGTERFPKSELIEYLRSLGMRWGPEVNAYTSYDQTVYGIEVPVEADGEGRKIVPDQALAVIDDWTRAVTFAPEEVDSERGVVLEEYRTRLGAWERIWRKMAAVIFKGTPYVDRFPIGVPEIIGSAPRERLVDYYRTWYRADNMALVFVGDFDGEKLETELASHFSASAPASSLERPSLIPSNPKKGNLAVEINTDPELPHTRIDLFYKLPVNKLTNETDLASYRQGIINNLIDRMLSMRFDEAAHKPDTPYTAAGAGLSEYAGAVNNYMFIAIAKTGSAEAALSALLLEKEKMARYGFTDSEIDQAKRSLLADMERIVSEKDRQHSSGYLDSFVNHFINGDTPTDTSWDLNALTVLLPGISTREIAGAAKNYFAYKDLTVFISAPDADAASLPNPDTVRRLVKQSERASVPRPVNENLDATLLDRRPTPGSISSETKDESSGTIQWELSNGAKVILKETKNKNNQIVLYAMARGGLTSVPENQIVSADLSAEMMSASGVGPYSRSDLAKKLADKQVSISFGVSGMLRNVQGSSTTGDLQTLFELLYLHFTQPRIDPEPVASLIDDYRTELAQRNENPEALFYDEVTRTLYNNNIYYKPMAMEDLEKINIDDALAFLKQASNPGDYTFVFTGNLDIPALRSFTEAYLASIPPGETWNTWTDPQIVRPENVEREVRKGLEEKSLVYLSWMLPKTEYTAAGSAAADVLSEYLDNKLMERIRKQMGGAYSISGNVSLSPLPSPGETTMSVYFPCDPQRVQELRTAVMEELELVAKGTIDKDAFNKSVEGLKKSFDLKMQDNGYIGRSLAYLTTLYNLPLSHLEQPPELYQAVTVQDLQGMMGKLLARGVVSVILYPAN
ncbi:putative peptidase, M16 family [Treponema primitia ZAS-2]|uniref:Putative peptidase, M16 family n=1 Tax=Treponema primitia (strain ATCC BAA-887 / DSM 12427 / ZAS-2) TaxID=545694 RepID=F5YN14_TREPZ|nr:M16 family metallopeptidase [Treponema primitia]AEF85228.1 putative peptidase, M16 family [Treponema primitia ZAS-2]